MARIAPEARVIDVSHGIERHDVRSGALVLRRALPYFHRACTSRSWTPRSAASGGPSPCARQRTTASWSGPTTACWRWPSSAWGRGGGHRRRPLAHRLEPTSAAFHGRDLSRRSAAIWRPGTPGRRRRPDRRRRADAAAHAHRPSRRHRPRRRRPGLPPLRQRHARRRARRAGRLGAEARPPGHHQRGARPLRHDVRRRPAGRAAALRGRLPDAGAGRGRGSAAMHLGLDIDAEIHIRPAAG